MFSKIFAKLRRDTSGATLVEYGIALVLAVIVGTAGLITLAGTINGNLEEASASMEVTE